MRLVMIICAVLLAACSPQPETTSSQTSQATNPATVVLSDAKIRAAFAGAATGAAYVTIQNDTATDVTLTSVSVAETLAKSVELHDMLMDGEMMKMVEITDGIVIPANGSVALKPGGKHVMFMGLQTTLDEGKSFDLTFNFANQPAQTISVPVVKL